MARRVTGRVTSKGQVKVPGEARQAFGIDLRFEVEAGGAWLRVVKRRRLSSLFAALPASRSFPGKAALPDAVGKALGRPGDPLHL